MRALVTFRTIFRRVGDVRSGAFGRVGGVRSEAGFTLIEALMAAVILVVGLIGLLGLLDTSVKASAATRAREGATSLAREILEDARTIPYAQIIPTSIESQLQAMPVESTPPTYPLADGSSAPGWQIERRGFSYTVKVEECAIDDPKDGLATQEVHEKAKTFCEGQTAWKAGEAEDTTPEDLKRITAEVSWTIQKRTSTVKQVSTLTAAGQAVGLVARELHLVEPPYSYNKISTAPVIAEAATKTLTFSVSFPEGTHKIIWSLEGAKQGEVAPASNAKSLEFSWTISELKQKTCSSEGTSDGTYQVSAQAEDATGIIGPPISIPVRLIRGIPVAPCGIIGGFNTIYEEKGGKPLAAKVAELQWKANAERDVIGYRVYRPGGGPGTTNGLACPSSSLETLSTATSCIDFFPAEGTYSVFALYRNASEEVKESAAGTISVALATSTAPEPTTNLTIKKENDIATLEWKAPASGVKPEFYRIYRCSEKCTSPPYYTYRYAETTETKFTDTDATSTHTYWVTAVSSTMTESTFQEVTG